MLKKRPSATRRLAGIAAAFMVGATLLGSHALAADLSGFIPDDAMVAASVQMARVRGKNAFLPVIQIQERSVIVEPDVRNPDDNGEAVATAHDYLVPMDDIEQLLWVMRKEIFKYDAQLSNAFVVRTARPFDKETVLEPYGKKVTTQRLIDGTTIYLLPDQQRRAVVFVDNRTILAGDETKTLIAMLAANRVNHFHEQDLWKKVEHHDMVCYVNSWYHHYQIIEAAEKLADTVDKQLALNMVRPLLTRSKHGVMGVTLGKPTQLDVYLRSEQDVEAKHVAATIQALVKMAELVLSEQQSRPQGDQAVSIAMAVLKLAAPMLQSVKITVDGGTVQLKASLPNDPSAALRALLLPLVQAARDRSARVFSKNNLKKIGLALHNYHDRAGHFPAANLVSQGGKHRHSWRVEILPYIDEGPLYQQYRFDEPWDSEDNKKVLAQMPAVYRNPLDRTGSTSTSYFALSGEDTGFGEPNGGGQVIRNFTDGTTNSLLVVEAKKQVPWTKPEDFEIDLTKEKLPKFGGWHAGGYHALYADGSVKLLSLDIEVKKLRNLIQINDYRLRRFRE